MGYTPYGCTPIMGTVPIMNMIPKMANGPLDVPRRRRDRPLLTFQDKGLEARELGMVAGVKWFERARFQR